MRSGRSENGLRYAVKSSASKVGYCSLSVKCGTCAEGDLPEGTAHFVEHTIFKGTKRLSAARINSYLDRLGGELNAYTTKEEIVLHATVLREDIWKAVGLLMEIATEATFPEHEVALASARPGTPPSPSKSVPKPTWSIPITWTAWSRWAITSRIVA